MRADSEFFTADCFSCAVDNSVAMLVTSLLDSKPFEIFSGQRDIKVNWPELKGARPLAPFLLPNESAPTSWLARPKSIHESFLPQIAFLAPSTILFAMLVTSLLDSKPFEIFSGQRDIKIKSSRTLCLSQAVQGNSSSQIPGHGDYTPIFLSEIAKLFSSFRQHVDVAIVTISPPDEHGNCTLGLAADCTVEAVRAAKTIIGHGDYTPIFLSEIAKLLSSFRQHVDVAIITISPPDKHGYCTLGVGADCTVEAARAAKIIIGRCTFDSPQSHLLMICT
uniref:Acetyl-CoA hydrolase/transferase N-terminal domain-containing protein n=1 Tax=Ascaris lumbricoides TaxID=6252 RepID=A0A0M3IV41_ASCLU